MISGRQPHPSLAAAKPNRIASSRVRLTAGVCIGSVPFRCPCGPGVPVSYAFAGDARLWAGSAQGLHRPSHDVFGHEIGLSVAKFAYGPGAKPRHRQASGASRQSRDDSPWSARRDHRRRERPPVICQQSPSMRNEGRPRN